MVLGKSFQRKKGFSFSLGNTVLMSWRLPAKDSLGSRTKGWTGTWPWEKLDPLPQAASEWVSSDWSSSWWVAGTSETPFPSQELLTAASYNRIFNQPKKPLTSQEKYKLLKIKDKCQCHISVLHYLSESIKWSHVFHPENSNAPIRPVSFSIFSNSRVHWFLCFFF